MVTAVMVALVILGGLVAWGAAEAVVITVLRAANRWWRWF